MMLTSASALLLLASTASAAPLEIAGVTASSTYPPQDGVKYEAKYLADNKQSLAWFEGDDGSGLGAWVELTLDGSQTVHAFRIWNGYQLTWDMFQRNNRVKDLEVEIGGEEFSFQLEDTFGPQEIKLPKAVSADKVTFRIKGIHSGNTFNDTAISEIMLLDDKPAPWVQPTGFSASSAYPDDADGTYGAENVGDGLVDTMWCEGNKGGDGTGEWVQLDLGGSKQVGSIKVNNGNAASFSTFMKANSATGATVTWSDGSTEKITIKPTMMDQVISVGPKSTSSVKITFDEIRKGKEFDDLCISEIRLMP